MTSTTSTTTVNDTTATATITDATARPLDQQRLDDFLSRFGADQAAAMHAATVVLGDRLGLFRALAHGGRQSARELATRTGLERRLVLEWLRVQAVSGYCEHDAQDDVYWLTAEQAACLADDTSPTFVAGGLRTATAVHRGVEQVDAAFRGQGDLPWGDHDPNLFAGVERSFRSAYEVHLAGAWIPALEGIEERLRSGGRAADLGCGFGTSTVVLARAFPTATVAGFDRHDVSIDAARRKAAEAGVADRVTFEVADAAALPGTDYDLVCMFNALHEMGDPVAVCRRVRGRLADGGSLMLVEPLAGDTLADNRTPLGRSFLSASTMICLPSAISQGSGRHLGAQAPDDEFAVVAAEAGFGSCRRVAQTPLHRVLELRD